MVGLGTVMTDSCLYLGSALAGVSPDQLTGSCPYLGSALIGVPYHFWGLALIVVPRDKGPIAGSIWDQPGY